MTPTPMDDIMIDLETLDTAVTGAIIAIGACRFNADMIEDGGFYRAIKIQSNIDAGRTISGATLAWWMDQSEAARAVFNDPDAIPLRQALDEFREWLGTDDIARLNMRPWSNGADFDIPMLTNAWGAQGTPWRFFNTRCFRTAKSEPKARAVPKPANAMAHHALADAIAQAQHLQAIWKVTRCETAIVPAAARVSTVAPLALAYRSSSTDSSAWALMTPHNTIRYWSQSRENVELHQRECPDETMVPIFIGDAINAWALRRAFANEKGTAEK